MSYSDLLERIKRNDTGAFVEMTDRYGWSVYSAVRKKYADPVMAEKVYNEAMNAFYRGLANSTAEDPVEALLCTFADHISVERLGTQTAETAPTYAPPKIQLDTAQDPVNASAPVVRKKHGFWYKLGVLLVLVAIAAVLWCLAGLLMDMNIIPYIDLGYSWFNTHVVHFF